MAVRLVLPTSGGDQAMRHKFQIRRPMLDWCWCEFPFLLYIRKIRTTWTALMYQGTFANTIR